MATNLTFTSTSFYQGTTMSATASTPATGKDILGGTASYDRRLYGISATSTDTVARDMTLWFGTSTQYFQIARIAIPVNAGNTNAIGQVDILGDSKFAGTFQKQADANGKPYFNLPAGYTIVAGTPQTTAGTFITVHTFGENYN
jgi:hypothetical protein